MAKAVFKDYSQGQSTLFPTDLGTLIDQSVPVRIVNTVVDKLDISDILSTYKGGGTSSFHPRMMLKSYFTHT